MNATADSKGCPSRRSGWRSSKPRCGRHKAFNTSPRTACATRQHSRRTWPNRAAGRRRRRLGHATIVDLINHIGFDGVDAGGLGDSWRQQPGTPVYCTDLGTDGVREGPDHGEAGADRRLAGRWAGESTVSRRGIEGTLQPCRSGHDHGCPSARFPPSGRRRRGVRRVCRSCASGSPSCAPASGATAQPIAAR